MSPSTYKFGEFELDSSRFELSRNGRVLKIQRIPLELLILMLERRGQIVSREEIVERLWGKDVFVDTEHGINTAIRKIRAALRDDVESPRFVQTVSGKGYRFVPEALRTNGNGDVAIETPAPMPASLLPGAPEAPANNPSLRPRFFWLATLAFALLIIAGVVLLDLGGWRSRLFSRSNTGPIHSIAVIPLANLSGDPSQDYFADGMTDELIQHSRRIAPCVSFPVLQPCNTRESVAPCLTSRANSASMEFWKDPFPALRIVCI